MELSSLIVLSLGSLFSCMAKVSSIWGLILVRPDAQIFLSKILNNDCFTLLSFCWFSRLAILCWRSPYLFVDLNRIFCHFSYFLPIYFLFPAAALLCPQGLLETNWGIFHRNWVHPAFPYWSEYLSLVGPFGRTILVKLHLKVIASIWFTARFTFPELQTW